MKKTIAALALATAFASTAQAQEKDLELSIAAGGGVSGFITNMADQTKVGGSWDVRARLRTRFPIGAEIGYVGTANGVGDRMATNAPNGVILGNGFEANAVLSVLPRSLPISDRIDPYVFVGAGYTRFQLVNESSFNPSVLRKHDDAFALPSGAGLTLHVTDSLLADARFTYRAIFDDGMVHLPGQRDALNMSQWGATAGLAYEF